MPTKRQRGQIARSSWPGGSTRFRPEWPGYMGAALNVYFWTDELATAQSWLAVAALRSGARLCARRVGTRSGRGLRKNRRAASVARLRLPRRGGRGSARPRRSVGLLLLSHLEELAGQAPAALATS